MVTISGKISFFRGKYQITNPTHVSTDKNKVKKRVAKKKKVVKKRKAVNKKKAKKKRKRKK